MESFIIFCTMSNIANSPDDQTAAPAIDENQLIAERREKLKALRAEFALKAQATQAQNGPGAP